MIKETDTRIVRLEIKRGRIRLVVHTHLIPFFIIIPYINSLLKSPHTNLLHYTLNIDGFIA